jgi:coenzyme F420-reducing hydrogenase delta subunit/Fe-S-cluster-containing hydrogenase component 2
VDRIERWNRDLKRENCIAAININQDYCSKCSICHSVCPFDAIKRDKETGKVEVDLQKCQVCGICYSACPAMAIEIVYYDYDSLVKRVKEMHEKRDSDTLVLTCRGNSPSSGEVPEILRENGIDVSNYIHLRLPCAGRIPTEFVFKVLNLGIRRIVSIQCEDNFCRFKEGTKINTRRLALGQKVLDQLGLDKDVFTVIKYARKAVYDTAKCVGCDKCVYICPYKAIEAEPISTPKILEEKCVGCGACALVCPHKAIEVKGFEFDNVLKLYTDAAKKLKAQGVSPLILVFACQWSEFPALDEPNSPFSRKGTFVVEVPCFKALDPVHILNALQNGFDGVMAAVCPPEDCKLEEGKETAERNVAVLKNVLKNMGLLQRFELFNVHPRCASDFNDRFGEFYTKIARMKLKSEPLEANFHE